MQRRLAIRYGRRWQRRVRHRRLPRLPLSPDTPVYRIGFAGLETIPLHVRPSLSAVIEGERRKAA